MLLFEKLTICLARQCSQLLGGGCDWRLWGQVVPILRAGLVLLEQATTVLPCSQTFHVGYVRNEETLEVCASLNMFLNRHSSPLSCTPDRLHPLTSHPLLKKEHASR
jgi:hypothetical protein